ncbi:LysR family transcriptional regulator substrate-binding protein [Naumannella sp. ID2617S]|nr:LysR family transcriptional regulator substrate-binding protein [Naumannella sp. ID2617S]
MRETKLDAAQFVQFPHGGVTQLDLGRGQVSGELCRNHPLSTATELTWAQIEDEAFLALPESAGPLRDFWLATDRRTRPARIVGVVSSIEAATEGVTAGVGVCLVAAGNAPFLSRPGIVAVPVLDLPPSRLVLA